MMAIRLLSPDVSSKIAAGEVVERPSSVVKELVENALDVEAKEIDVEIRGGGVEYVRVTDNGSGIPSDEIDLAVQRFATSKVATVGDLEAISTLGFRGEALHSIASVSTFSLVTRSAEDESGSRLEVRDGEIASRVREGVPRGTSVTVRHLFRSFPARRKFLRSVATETSRVQTLVTRYALAYPEVGFRLSLNGSVSFSSPGSGDLREAVSSVYGSDVAGAMLELSSDGDDPAVEGLISPPSLDRANRSYMSFFVNRRWVQNRMLGYAFEQAYHGFLKERRYPLAVVDVSISYQDVDVNVHPAKAEIRFRRDNQVFGAVQHAVRRALTAHSPVPEIRHAPVTQPLSSSRPQGPVFWPVEPFDRPGGASRLGLSTMQSPDPVSAEQSLHKKTLPVLRVLGQVQKTYITAEGPDGLYLIDQHAAHERVVFEEVKAESASRAPQSQSLLEPLTVELDAAQQELLRSHEELIFRVGFLVEPFGAGAYLLRGVPRLLAQGDPSRALLDVLDMMAEGGGYELWEERAAYSVACHGAIRAGLVLSHDEMSELIRQLEACHQPNTCPHGRPTMIHLSSGHLEREFGRR